MFWQKHHPWFRRALLVANGLLALAFLVCLALRAWTPFVVLLSVAMFFHAFLMVAIFHPRCPWLGPVVRGFRTDRRAVWLTIDDGPDGDSSVRLAEELRQRGVRATFFVVGERVRQQPEVVRAIVGAGHTLANHSDTHPRATIWCAGAGRVAREVEGGAAALAAHGGHGNWFRAPVGHKSPWLHRVLRVKDRSLVAWTVGGRDGSDADPAPLVRRVLDRVRPGAILLLHEARRYSVETVLAVIEALQAKGWEFAVPAEGDLE